MGRGVPMPQSPMAFSPDAAALAERGVRRRWRKGQALIVEGSHDDTLFFIHEGRLRAYSGADNGREITFGIYGPGDWLGEMSLDGGPRSAHVVALEASVCSQVTRHTLEAFIAERPAFAFELIAKVIRRARAATVSARSLALEDVYGRLRALLDSLAQSQPDGSRAILERLTHREIAQRLGCSREMVSRLMKDLEVGELLCPTASGGYVLMRPLPARW